VRYTGLVPAIRPWAAIDGPLGPPLPAAARQGLGMGCFSSAGYYGNRGRMRPARLAPASGAA